MPELHERMKAPVHVAANPDRNTATRFTGASTLAVARVWGTATVSNLVRDRLARVFAMDQVTPGAALTEVPSRRLQQGERTA